MKRHQNALLLLAVVLLAVLPLWLVEQPANGADLFAGADNKAMELIGQIAPTYQPWFAPLLEPASGEIASLLFAVQAALGAGFIGYYLGVSVTREKMCRAAAQNPEKAAGAD